MSGSIDYDKAKRIDKARNYGVNRNVDKIPKKVPPTEAQLNLIKILKDKLDGIGKDTSYLAEPDSKLVAIHVIDSLLRLCKKYNL